MELVRDPRLIGDDGLPLFGLHSGPIEIFNIDELRQRGREKSSKARTELIKDFQLKRWLYLGVCDRDIVFGAAIVHLGYLSNVFAYAFERGNGKLTEFGANQPLAAHTEFTGSFMDGTARFQAGGADIRMRNQAGSIGLLANVEGRLEAELEFTGIGAGLSLVTRVGLERFNYTTKEAGLAVRGRIRAAGREYALEGDAPRGIADYTYGYLARYTFWNWAAGAGLAADGTRIGFNLSQGVNETGFTENAFWADGAMVKADLADFRYDDLDPLKPWRVRTADGKVDLSFKPEGQRTSRVNLGIISSRFRQPFGSYSGRLTDGRRTWELGDVSGFVEEHESTW